MYSSFQLQFQFQCLTSNVDFSKYPHVTKLAVLLRTFQLMQITIAGFLYGFFFKIKIQCWRTYNIDVDDNSVIIMIF